MNVTGKTKIYRKDFEDANGNARPAYSRSIASKKYENGHKIDEWIREYESVQLPRGAELPDRAEIQVTKAFETVYQTKNGVKRKLVIQDYKTDEENTSQAPPQEQKEEQPNFAEIDADVPF